MPTSFIDNEKEKEKKKMLDKQEINEEEFIFIWNFQKWFRRNEKNCSFLRVRNIKMIFIDWSK